VAKKYSYKIEKRENVGILVDLVSIGVALLASIAVASVIILNSGADAKTVLWAIVKGSFGSTTAIVETLNLATPILFTGLATVIAYRAKVWNIGQEGQLYAGAMAMTFVILTFPNTQLPAVIYVPLLLIVAIIGGLLWGSIPGILKAKYNVNEIIVTVMLNYIIMYVCTFLLNGVWQEPGSFYYNTIPFPESSNSPLLFGTKLHIGFPLALLLAFVVYFILWKTRLGYEIRAIGLNPVASTYKGINTKWVILVVMLISGAISGLAGGVELLGIHHRLIFGFSSSFGFTGILIALLGRLHPLGVVLAAIFFGALRNGSTAMRIYSNVSGEIVTLIMGLVIIMLLFCEALFKYRIRRVENVD
jgi:ABC-type uncharacterized transport system permease subunit